MSEFIIENGVLVKYIGEGGRVVVPEEVKTISRFAFMYGITEIVIPPTVKKMQMCCLPEDCIVHGQEGSAADIYVQRYGGTFVATIPAAPKKELNTEIKGKVSDRRAVALLEDAVLSKDLERVRHVVEKCAPFEFGARALGLACRTGCMDIVSYLLKNKFSFTYSTTDQQLNSKYALVYKPSSKKYQADFLCLAVVSDVWNRYLFGYVEKSYPPEKLQIGWDSGLGCEKVLSPVPPNMVLGNPKDRAEVLEYLYKKKKIKNVALNRLLYYAILENDTVIIEKLGALGAVVDAPWLDSEKYTVSHKAEWNRFMSTLLSKDIPTQKNIFRWLNRYMKAAGCKLGLRDSVLEKIPCNRDEEYATIILENADLSMVTKLNYIKSLISPTVPAAVLNVFVKAGFAKGYALEEMIHQADRLRLSEHKTILENHQNKTANNNLNTPNDCSNTRDRQNCLETSVLRKSFKTKSFADGTLCITKYIGNGERVTVPAQFGEEIVTAIGKAAFSGCSNLKYIELPQGIVKIGINAFQECTNLECVTSCDEVLSILWPVLSTTQKNTILLNMVREKRQGTFLQQKIKRNQKKLVECAIKTDDAGLLETILSYFKKVSIGEIDSYIQEAVGSVHVTAFLLDYKSRMYSTDDQDTYTSAEIDKALSIAERKSVDWKKIFAYQKNNKGIVITGYKGEEANVIIPQKIGENVIVEIAEAAFSSAAEKISKSVKQSRTELVSVTIPLGVKKIGQNAFMHCKHLTNIEIPESITNVGGFAFYGCEGLTEIIFSGKLNKISRYTFADCKHLKCVTIPDTVKEIGEYAFQNCTNLISITIPDSVKAMGVAVFSGCHALKEIKLPKNITTIEGATFYKCASLDSVCVPDSVHSIKVNAFYGCENLCEIRISSGVVEIDKTAFSKCRNLTIYAPAGSYAETYAKENNIPFAAE